MFERVIIKSVSTVFALAVTGCSPDSARYTVDEYRADAPLRHSQMELCKADPGSLAKTPDCINARQAAALEDRVRLREMPSVGLSAKPASSKESDADLTRAEAANESPAPPR
jgi:hypothetical protein